jgi:hypothetical protein
MTFDNYKLLQIRTFVKRFSSACEKLQFSLTIAFLEQNWVSLFFICLKMFLVMFYCLVRFLRQFGVEAVNGGDVWCGSHYPIERCTDMELLQTCCSTSDFKIPCWCPFCVELLCAKWLVLPDGCLAFCWCVLLLLVHMLR